MPPRPSNLRFSHTFLTACRRPHSFPFADRARRACSFSQMSADFHRHPPILRANMPPPAPFCRRNLKIKTPRPSNLRFSHTFFEACRRPHSFPFADRTCRAVSSPIPLFLQRNSFCKSRKHPVSAHAARSLPLNCKKVRFLNSCPLLTARQSPRRKRFRAFLTLEVKRTTPISREFRCFYNVIRFVNPQNTQFPRPPHGFSANSVVFTT